MRVLSIVHQADAAAGVFADAVTDRGHALDEWVISTAPGPPKPLEDYGAVLVFGGAMHVDQEDRHGWLHDERLLLQRLLADEVPLLGVCLGGAARCQGAPRPRPPHAQPRDRVAAGRAHPRGGSDPLFGGLPEPLPHLPVAPVPLRAPGRCRALAKNERCLQAFRAGARTWAIQFHAEVTHESAARLAPLVRSRRRTASSTSQRLTAETEERIGELERVRARPLWALSCGRRS